MTARQGRLFALLIGVLALAVLLAPVQQARIHTYTSLFKHDDYGAWFGCAVAGYAVAALSRAVPPVKAAASFRAGVLVVALAALLGVPMASRQYDWPNTAKLMAYMPGVLAAHPGPVLSDDGGVLLHYYLQQQVGARPVVGTSYISYRGPGELGRRTGLAGYADAIRHRYFSVIMLEFVDNLGLDRSIERYISASQRYQFVKYFEYPVPGGAREFMVWIRKATT